MTNRILTPTGATVWSQALRCASRLRALSQWRRLFARHAGVGVDGITAWNDAAIYLKGGILHVLFFDAVANTVQFDSILPPLSTKSVRFGGVAATYDGAHLMITRWNDALVGKHPVFHSYFWTGLLLYEWGTGDCTEPVQVLWPYEDTAPGSVAYDGERFQVLALRETADGAFFPQAIMAYDIRTRSLQARPLNSSGFYPVPRHTDWSLLPIAHRMAVVDISGSQAVFLDDGSRIRYRDPATQSTIGLAADGQAIVLSKDGRINWTLARLLANGTREVLRTWRGRKRLVVTHIALTANNALVAIDDREDVWMLLPDGTHWQKMALTYGHAIESGCMREARCNINRL